MTEVCKFKVNYKNVKFKKVLVKTYHNYKYTTPFLLGAIKVEVGQPLFFYIIGSNKLLTDISIP